MVLYILRLLQDTFKRAHDKYRTLPRHVTHLCATRNRNFKSVFLFHPSERLLFQTTFRRLISLIFFEEKIPGQSR